MHILIFPSFYPSKARPVSGIFFKAQAQALHNAGHKIGVLVAPRIIETVDHIRRLRSFPNLSTATFESGADFPVYRMHWGWFPRIFPLINAFLHQDAGFRAFKRYYTEQGKPDVIHAHNTFYSGLIAARIGQKYNIPVILTEHSSNFVRGRVFLPGQHAVVRYTFRHTDRLIAVSAALRAKLQPYAPEREFIYLGNVIDTDFFTYDDAFRLDTSFTFGFVAAKLIPLKRVDLLLQAFSQAFKGRADVRLRIGGGGDERATYETLARELGISQQVEFLGLLDRDGIRSLFQHVHCVVSTSDVETFGVTLIEAMACGKPVIATRSGGPDGFVNEGNGLLVPVADVQAMAEAMQRMVNTYSQYDSQHIREECVARFSEAAIVRQLETIYASVLSS